MDHPDKQAPLRADVVIPPGLLAEARRIAESLYRAGCYEETATLLDQILAADQTDAWSLSLYASVKQQLRALD
jgi:hypothetical protein